ncbi:hypothetical protein HK102_002200 [Quaeritorhiza haematococci]|nr:hypothetical protein HK102_002200 [Quaeritorhiza haematococci]
MSSEAPLHSGKPSIDRFIELVGITGPAWKFNFFFQFCMVGFVWSRVGNGKYWHTLFIVSAFGLYAALMENILDVEYRATDNSELFILSIVAELGWIISEFAPILLALFRLEAFVTTRNYRILAGVIAICGALFAAFRFRIGVMRYQLKAIGTPEIWNAHAPAFSVLAIGNFICSGVIIYRIAGDIRRANSIGFVQRLHKHLLNSSLFVLLGVDIMGALLAIATFAPDQRLQTFLFVFLNFKALFPLILTVDALVLRLTGRMEGTHGSENLTGKTAAGGTVSTAERPKPISSMSQGKDMA